MSGEGRFAARAGSDPRIEDRIVRILRLRHGAMGFNGLRRALEVHPESLTRALRRLERYGQVSRSEGGYRLTDLLPPVDAGRTVPANWRSVGEVELLGGQSAEQILGTLAGRWVGTLRWAGVYDRPGAAFLAWSRTDGSGQVLLGVPNGRLQVFVEPAEGSSDEEAELHRAARELLIFALGRLRGVGSTAPTAGAVGYRLDGARAATFAS